MLRRAVDVDALGQREEDLLVPHGRHPLEHPVHEADGARPAQRRPEDVAVSGGRAVLGVEHLSRVVVRQRRPEEHDDGCGHALAQARRRGPGTAGATLSVQPSSPGTTIRTTGTPTSGRVRSTRIACRIPAARSRSSSRVHVVVDGRPGDVRDVLERPARVGVERAHVRPDRPGVLDLAVEGRWAVVAAARDQRQPALRRLGRARARARRRGRDGSRRRSRQEGVAGRRSAAIDDRRGENGQADVGRQVPRDDADPGALERLEQPATARVGDSCRGRCGAPPGRRPGGRPRARTRRAPRPRTARGSPPRADGCQRRAPCRSRGSSRSLAGRASGSRDGRTRTAPTGRRRR